MVQLLPGATLLCSPGLQAPAGIYPGTGGVFVEDWNTGNLLFCASGSTTTIATAPSGGAGKGYFGMAGVKTGIGLVLVLVSWPLAGLWFCFGATSSGCSIKSTFIPLPSGFCTSQPFGKCNPDGVALDSKLNLYYADLANADVVKCTYTSGYQSCSVLENLTGSQPVGIFRATNGDIWVSDQSCAGHVWKNGVVQYTVGEGLYGITISSANPSKSPHVYVGYSGLCGSTAAHILDLNDGKSLPTLLVGPDAIPGLTTKLQFTAWSTGTVYSTKDTS